MHKATMKDKLQLCH